MKRLRTIKSSVCLKLFSAVNLCATPRAGSCHEPLLTTRPCCQACSLGLKQKWLFRTAWWGTLHWEGSPVPASISSSPWCWRKLESWHPLSLGRGMRSEGGHPEDGWCGPAPASPCPPGFGPPFCLVTALFGLSVDHRNSREGWGETGLKLGPCAAASYSFTPPGSNCILLQLPWSAFPTASS